MMLLQLGQRQTPTLVVSSADVHEKSAIFRVIREEEVAELVNKLREASSNDECVNLSEMLISTSNNVVCKCALGRKYAGGSYDKVKELARNVMVHLMAFTVRDYFPLLGWIDVLSGKIREFKATFRALDALFDQAVAEHLAVKTESDHSKRKDFVDFNRIPCLPLSSQILTSKHF
ncbi:Cytochrome P450 [Sesbania bispinosa]|nr:Cytochrome P450 [Sesbania bispinosa]